MILSYVFHECNMLDRIRVPCKALIITWNSDGQRFVCATDEIASEISHKKLVIASECFNSICPAEFSGIEIAIVRIIGEEIIRLHIWLEALRYDEWDEKCQQLRALMAPYEKRHKNEIASLLELRLWKVEMGKIGDISDESTRAEYRPQRGVAGLR